MLAAGFVAGWFAGELHRQRSPVLAPADDLNVTGNKSYFPRLRCQQPQLCQSAETSLFAIPSDSSEFNDCLADANC